MFATDHNEFALALFAQLLEKGRNQLFSPFSIRTVLGMAYAGARGDTAIEMSKALRFTISDETLHTAFADMIRRLNGSGEGRHELTMAHSLWGQQGAPLLSGFLDLVTRNYGSEMRVVNFSCDPEGACRAINSWVETKTHERIRDLIGRLDRDTRLVVVNTVYFKGKWALEFTELATRDEPFYLEGGGTVQARLMHEQEEVRYLQADGFQVVDLDYRGGDLSLLVLLPDTRDGLGDLEARLSAHLFRDCVAKMAVREVEVLLPRFKMTCRLDVRDDLCALGMPRAFQRLQADFSGINGHTPPHQDALFISAVCHQAFIEVNEQGTEAAAATGISMMRVGMAHYEPAPVPIFRANHPFLFAIRDRKSTAILFLGRMADPTRES